MRFTACLTSIALVSVSQAAQFSVELVVTGGPTIAGMVDTRTDSFRITSWTDAAPAPWLLIPMPDQLPLTLRAYSPANALFDIPDSWSGNLGVTAGWAFLLPIGQDLTTLRWIQRPPNTYWTGASFGWGGLRNSLGRTVLKDQEMFWYLPAVADEALHGVPLTSSTITPVPQPATLALLALGGYIVLRRRR